MRIGVPKETLQGETRVALVPETIKRLAKQGHETVVEAGAGVSSSVLDDDYREVGARVGGRDEALGADIVCVVNPLDPADVGKLRSGALLVGLLRPTAHGEFVKALADRKVDSLSFDLVPRITRAQSMDVLSSMATCAGYRATILGAEACPKFFPMLMTAAGTVRPAQVLVIGAGVAGLQAIATSHRLGAVVYSYDVRPAVKEQVESLGARFVELEEDVGGEGEGGYAQEQTAEQQARQAALLADAIADADVVITTAAIPGRPAPKIIQEDAVGRMRHGSVIVDIAAETGGNCVLTRAGETVVTDGGVTILGPVNIPAAMPVPASQMYSRNVLSLLGECLTKEGGLELDPEGDVLCGALLTLDGEVRHPQTREILGLPPLQAAAQGDDA
jgi:NAD(P) transhydrogenase subunit alpha